jgi:hypothetical protein
MDLNNMNKQTLTDKMLEYLELGGAMEKENRTAARNYFFGKAYSVMKFIEWL